MEPCEENQTRCDSGECIPSEWFCDDYNDCADRSDELMCCPDTQFNCANGRCIEWDTWCDGNNDCRDNSDEDECAGKVIIYFSDNIVNILFKSRFKSKENVWFDMFEVCVF